MYRPGTYRPSPGYVRSTMYRAQFAYSMHTSACLDLTLCTYGVCTEISIRLKEKGKRHSPSDLDSIAERGNDTTPRFLSPTALSGILMYLPDGRSTAQVSWKYLSLVLIPLQRTVPYRTVPHRTEPYRSVMHVLLESLLLELLVPNSQGLSSKYQT